MMGVQVGILIKRANIFNCPDPKLNLTEQKAELKNL